jgi:Protein of unknown function (DUF1501)
MATSPLHPQPPTRAASRRFSRRDLLRLAALGLGTSACGWFQALAGETARDPRRQRSCILLWMTGGPSQTDTFDMKPGHENGGEFKPIDTSVPGIQISEHLPRLARVMDHVALVRSMSTREGDHSRATYLVRTGYLPQGPVHYPPLGALLSHSLDSGDSELPGYVSVAPYRFFSPAAYGPGFLGPQYAPLVVGEDTGPGIRQPGQYDDEALRVRNLELPPGIDRARTDARLSLWSEFESEFVSTRPGVPAETHRAAYDKAVRMMRSEAVKAFDLDGEPEELRDAYGRNRFGQGCLLARRLVERGVPFIEVSLNGPSEMGSFAWDTHRDNFRSVRRLCEVLDPAWATLLTDLKQRGLLDTTLVVWMGEFGRTPAINGGAGRDHFATAWTTALCGGGVTGGAAVGRTSADGQTIEDRPVAIHDLVATICLALGVDPLDQNMSNVGRPIRLADPEAKPLREVLS